MCEVKVSIIATAIENSTLEIHCMFFEKIYLCVCVKIQVCDLGDREVVSGTFL